MGKSKVDTNIVYLLISGIKAQLEMAVDSERQTTTKVSKQHDSKALSIADVSKRSEQLVCDYCGKPKPKGDEPCDCGKGDFWVVKEAN